MADNNNMFQVKIITPDRELYNGQASMIEFTTVEGQIGVYKRHIPLTTPLSSGPVIIHEAEGERVAAVHSGFAQILPDEVVLLAEIAEWPEEIDVTRANKAKERAEEKLASMDAELDTLRAEYALRKALTRIDVKTNFR